MGPEGPQGSKGDKGEQGLKGDDGSMILSGEGKPKLVSGKVGDFYLDLSTTYLYGPKRNDSWGDSLLLKGTQGYPGTPGTQMLSGNGIPPVSYGAYGDFYFDKENISMYGPKGHVDWGTPVSLKSANENGIKVITIKNLTFPNDFHNDDYTSSSGSANVDQTIIPVVDYLKYYENGLIVVQIRDPKDPNGSWKDEIFHDVYGANSYFNQVGLSIAEDAGYRKDGINLKCFVRVYLGNDVESNIDFIQQEMTRLVNSYIIDIKIVLIPGTQVQLLKQQGVNLNDKEAISKVINSVN